MMNLLDGNNQWQVGVPINYRTNKITSIVFPFEAVTMSPGLMPVPLIMFSQAATIKWTYKYNKS